jgi:predicted nucleotidyltransferase
MSENSAKLIEMLEAVADALGDRLRSELAFVGGCTTALLVSDDVVLDDIRFTDDVDLVVELTGIAKWHSFEQTLRGKGFKPDQADGVICRMLLGELKVDFMPTDPEVLGFSNAWYREGLANASENLLPNGLKIRVFTAPYFLATKLEAFAGRGMGDVLGSKDIEDVLLVLNGREEISEELAAAPDDLRTYVAAKLKEVMTLPYFDGALQSTVHGDMSRARILYTTIVSIVKG